MAQAKYQIKSLSEDKDKLGTLVAFIEKHFPQGAPQEKALAFENEFGALLCQSNRERILYIEDVSGIIATTSWRPYTMKNGLRMASIGLVVTHPNHRKKGLSALLLQEAEKQAFKSGATVVCLWSNFVDHYMKYGYILAGSELSWDLNQKKVEASPQYSVSTIDDNDISKIALLYEKQPIGPTRSLEDFQRQLAQANSISLCAKNREGVTVAYALAGKGRDLRNIVHELIGEFEAFPALFEAMNDKLSTEKDFPKRIQFPFTHPQTTALEHSLGAADQGAVCFAKVLDLKKMVEAINSELQAQGLKDCLIKLPPSNGGIQAWKLECKNKQVFVSPDAAHLLQIFASPWPLEDIEGLGADVKKVLKSWTPYPLYFWGMDSV